MADIVHNPDTHKLGKAAPEPPRLQIADYVDMERLAEQAPAMVQNSFGTPLGMYGNDRIGDCTCASIGNILRVNSQGRDIPSEDDVVHAYSAISGYDPATGQNDNGAVEIKVLDYWMGVGVGSSSTNKIIGHAGVNHADLNEVKLSLYHFGAVYAGVNLAAIQQQQQVWDAGTGPSATPGSWGGHAVPIFDMNPNRLGTWGAYKEFTDAFLLEYMDEAHIVITQDWLDLNTNNPLINIGALLNALKTLTPET